MQNAKLDTVALDLFRASNSLFNLDLHTTPEVILINLVILQLQAFLLFDAISDSQSLLKDYRIMICLFVPDVSYSDRLQLKNTFNSMLLKIKQDKKINLKYYYEEIQAILAESNCYILKHIKFGN